MSHSYTPVDSRNNFDLIRLFAALTVLVAHITEHKLIANELAGQWVLAFYKTFPGVPIFFIISGLLISNSWLSSTSTWTYTKNRALRIYPALIASSLLTTGLMYLLGFTQGVPFVKIIEWPINQISLINIASLPEKMEGFAGNMPNGSLWTLPVEISFYLICPIILTLSYKLFRKSFKPLVYAFMVLSTMLYLSNNFGVETSAPDLRHLAFYHFWWFGLGIMFCLEFHTVKKYFENRFFTYLVLHIVWSWVVLNLDTIDQVKSILQSLTLAPLVFSAAYTAPHLAKKLIKKHDYSYGIYLFHRPYIHTLHHLGITGLSGAVCVLGITLATAAASWHFLEKPALKLKNRNPRL